MDKATVNKMAQEAFADNRPVEAGWISAKLGAMPPDMPEEFVDAMRLSYFLGAMHATVGFRKLHHAIIEDEEEDIEVILGVFARIADIILDEVQDNYGTNKELD